MSEPALVFGISFSLLLRKQMDKENKKTDITRARKFPKTFGFIDDFKNK